MSETDTVKTGTVVYDYSDADVMGKLEELETKIDEILEHLLELNLDRNPGYGIDG